MSEKYILTRNPSFSEGLNMKEYDAIIIGTGSAMHFIDALSNKDLKLLLLIKMK